MTKILIVTGGSGGHVIPAVNFGNFLINNGFENLHFYTLNQVTVTKAVCKTLSLEKVGV